MKCIDLSTGESVGHGRIKEVQGGHSRLQRFNIF